MADLYGFSEGSARRIAAAVKRIEGMAGDSTQDPYTPETTGTESFVDRHVGTFTGVWAKGTTADVTVTADNGSTYTETATNYFADVGESGVTSDCVIMQAGGEWVLVSASPVAECIELSKVEPTGNKTFQVVSNVACIDGNLSVTTTNISLSFSDLAALTTSSVTVPKQQGCN